MMSALVVIIIIGILVLVFKSIKVNNDDQPTVMNTSTPTNQPQGSSAAQTSGLKIEDLKVGTGDTAVAGKMVTVNYTGTLTNGTVFDSSVDPKFQHVEPFVFPLGAHKVIQGWDEGVAGMKVGGKRKLTIPPALGYGPAGAPPAIPGNATLIFEIELLKVE